VAVSDPVKHAEKLPVEHELGLRRSAPRRDLRAEQLAGRYRVDQGEPPLVGEMNVVLLQDDPCLVQDQIPFIARQARQLLAKVWQRNALHPVFPGA
jgi:hypothetical protein